MATEAQLIPSPYTGVKIFKAPYFDRLLDYYYDHIWSPESPGSDMLPIGFDDWLLYTYNAIHNRYDTYIRFDHPEDATLFILKWQ